MSETKTNVASRALSRGSATLRAAAIGLAVLALIGSSANAGNMYQPTTITAGGVPAQPTINMVTTATNETFSWYGMRGWSTIMSSTNVSGPFTNFFASTEATDYAWSVTASQPTNQMLFFSLIQTNYYAGSGACSGCHGAKYAAWSQSLHAVATSCIMDTNGAFTGHAGPSCVACHTVGYGQPTGFTTLAATPHLANVGCENCHGPAGWHKNSDHEVIRPAITVASEVCGGCHNSHNPQYTEWTNSMHALIQPDYASGISDTFSGQSRAVQCGACHSASVRIAMLNNYSDRIAGFNNPLVMPTAHDNTNYAQTCVVCHDPHSPTFVSTNWAYATNITYSTNIFSNYGIYYTNVVSATNINASSNLVAIPFQLRNPRNSTNYYTFFTATPTVVTAYTNFAGVVTYTTNYTADAFVSQYDPTVQICAQCHNGRGARWDGVGRTWNGSNLVASAASWSRGPHPADQYDILIGIVQPDYLNVNGSGVATNMAATHSGIFGAPGTHGYNTNQCSTCHVPIYTASSGATVSGHTFALDVNGCAVGGCHLSGVPDIGAFQLNTSNRMANVKALLNAWAMSNGPSLFGANFSKYMDDGWEYGTVGALGDPSYVGPSSADQLKIPNAIKQARFDLYMVQGDGSLGVHNPTYVPFLLNDAEGKVLGQFVSNSLTAFSARTVLTYTNTAVVFTNLTPGVASCSWDFGDGNTSTSTGLLVTNYYANSGPYTVTLATVNTNGVAGTMTRPNYINVYLKPVPSFTYTPGPYTHPATINFTNTSANADYYAWVFESGVTGSPFYNGANPPAFTYTNAGVYVIKFTAYNAAGNGGSGVSITVTNTVQ